MIQSVILPAMSYGLSATSMPGPLQAYLLNTTLRYGLRRALLIVLAPLIVDGPIIVMVVFFLGQMPEWVLQAIRIVGGLLLLWIAREAWKQLKMGVMFSADNNKEVPPDSARRIFGTAIAMNVFSPGPYLFWGTINGPLLLKALEIGTGAAIGMLVGFYGVFLGGLVVLAVTFNRLGRIRPETTRYLLLLTIVLLVWFGTGLIAEALNLVALHRIVSLIALVLGGVIQGYRYLTTKNHNVESRK